MRSLFVDDVASLFGPQLWERRRRRGLGAGRMASRRPRSPSAGAAPPSPVRATARRRPRRCAIRRCSHRSAGGRRGRSSDIEAYAGCPVKWLVERRLRLADARARRRDAAARRSRPRGAGARAAPPRPGERQHGPQPRPSAGGARGRRGGARGARRRASGCRPTRAACRALARRLEVDLLRYVEHAAHAGSSHVPTRFEVSFGGAQDELGPLRLSAPTWRSRGGSTASTSRPAAARRIVYDYKGRTTTDGAHWVDERKWQVALYLHRRAASCSTCSRPAACTSRSARATCVRAARCWRTPIPGSTSWAATGATRRGCEELRRRRRRQVLEAVSELRAGAPPAAPGDVRLRRRLLVPDDLPGERPAVRSFTDGAGDGAVDAARGPAAARGERRAAARRRCSWSASCGRCSTTACDPGRSWRSRSPRRRPASCARACGPASWRSASARRRGRPRAPGSGRSTASARGCCARHAVAAGLDPAFVVLDERRSRASCAATAWRRALRGLDRRRRRRGGRRRGRLRGGPPGGGDRRGPRRAAQRRRDGPGPAADPAGRAGRRGARRACTGRSRRRRRELAARQAGRAGRHRAGGRARRPHVPDVQDGGALRRARPRLRDRDAVERLATRRAATSARPAWPRGSGSC